MWPGKESAKHWNVETQCNGQAEHSAAGPEQRPWRGGCSRIAYLDAGETKIMIKAFQGSCEDAQGVIHAELLFLSPIVPGIRLSG